jgi:hypothetical protein
MTQKEKEVLKEFLNSIRSSVGTRSYSKEEDPEGWEIDEKEIAQYKYLAEICGAVKI